MCNFNLKVSVFAHKESKYPAEAINMWKWLLSEDRYIPVILQIRAGGTEEERKSLKSKLPAITPSGLFSKRSADCLIEPTNLICIDIDGKDNPLISDMEALKRSLSKLPYIMYCGLSASGTGVFCIIPYFDFNKHKLYFNALEQEFKDMGVFIDSSCSDICRLRFYSYDDKPFVNPDAEEYTHTLGKESEMKKLRFHRKLSVGCISNHAKREVQDNMLSPEEFLLLPTNLDIASALPLSKTLAVERFLNKVINEQVDITAIYKDWIAICHIIKNLFDEDGRTLFHQISSFYPNYDFDEADYKYSSVVRWGYKYNSDRIFEIAAQYEVS